MSANTAADHTVDPATNACSCGSDHDHGPTGSDVVQGLGKGFAVLSLAVPALAIVLIAGSLILTPSSPLVLLLGIGMGLGHLASLIALSAVASRVAGDLANSPVLLVARVGFEEALRLAVVLLGLVLFVGEGPGPLGLWIGVGAMTVWAVLTTAQLVMSRRRILRPGDWSKNTVLSVLNDKLSVRRAMTMRLVDIAAVLIFQLAATVLVAAAPIMAGAAFILSVASGFSTLVVQRYSAERRARSPWLYAPIVISVLTLLLAIALVLVPATIGV